MKNGKLKIVGFLVVVGVVAAVVFKVLQTPDTISDEGAKTNSATTSTSAGNSTAPTEPSKEAAKYHPEFDKLKGQWQRPDGGYVIEVKHIHGNGEVVAGYYNPRPINVGRAQAKRDNNQTILFVELQDTGYPGSTYTLVYHPERDEMEGVYFQAAMDSYYDVVFTRLK